MNANREKKTKKKQKTKENQRMLFVFFPPPSFVSPIMEELSDPA